MEKIRNAAIILLGIGEKYAGDILKNMSPKEIKSVIEEINKLDMVSEVEIIKALNDFFKDASGHNGIDLVTKEYLKNSLATAAEFGMLGAQQEGGVDKRSKWLEVMKWQPVDSIVSTIRDEHPQVIAVITSFILSSEKASKVIKELPKPLQNEVVRRVSNMDSVSAYAMEVLYTFFEMELEKSEKSNAVSVDGVEAVANIISYLDTETENELMSSLASADQNLSERILDKAFPFDRLTQLDTKSLQALLKEVNNDDLILALKGTDDFVRGKIMKNMSVKAADILRDELENKGPVKVSSVLEAQKRIVALAKKMASEEKIILSTKSDAEIIY